MSGQGIVSFMANLSCGLVCVGTVCFALAWASFPFCFSFIRLDSAKSISR